MVEMDGGEEGDGVGIVWEDGREDEEKEDGIEVIVDEYIIKYG